MISVMLTFFPSNISKQLMIEFSAIFKVLLILRPYFQDQSNEFLWQVFPKFPSVYKKLNNIIYLQDCFAAATGALSAAERSYPVSEVRGGSKECQAATAQEQPRRPTQVPGQGRPPGGATLRPRPEARSGGREDQPHIQGALAAWTQEGLEELSHIEGQEGRR